MTLELHSMQSMADVSIVGAAGYTGQETLDRVLGHPEPAPRRGRLRLAGRASRGARSTRDSPMPRCPRSSRTRRRSRTAPTSRSCASPMRLRPRSSRRPTGVVVDLSGAHRLRDAAAYEAWYGFTHPRPGGLGDWVYGLTELVAESGRLDREPRVLRDRDPARARAAEGRDRARTPSSSTGSPG